jgi:hypothetical protein
VISGPTAYLPAGGLVMVFCRTGLWLVRVDDGKAGWFTYEQLGFK